MSIFNKNFFFFFGKPSSVDLLSVSIFFFSKILIPLMATYLLLLILPVLKFIYIAIIEKQLL